MLTDEEFAQLVTLPHELRSVEFKPKGKRERNSYLFAAVAKACLAMANLPGGGRVMIGVDQTGETFDPVGVSEEELASWLQYDAVFEGINEYADPAIRFGIQSYVYDSKAFVVLEVEEFDDVPILCRKDYNDQNRRPPLHVLRRGACYVRSGNKAASTEVPSQSEMRELLDLAVGKGVRRYVRSALAAGFIIPGAPVVTDEERYKEKRHDLGE